MNPGVLFDAAGGLALFLLGMQLMTEGLKTFAAGGLKGLLGRWTSTPFRGVLAGFLVTGLVQSSTAVTVVIIGFINAGLLSLRQSLGVVYGSNVGSTVTGWLVSLVGFGFDIQALALPVLALGMALRLGAPGKRGRSLGEALAGFGLFFLGLDVLQEALGGVAASYGQALNASGHANVLMFVLAGLIATLLTQSSAATIAIVLTAAANGVLGLESAAGAVIGANLGTTSTAALAAMKATAAAKRLALGHIAFNLITALVALAMLPGLLVVVERLAAVLDAAGRPTVLLALFHTTFNVLGVLLLLPLTSRLERFLGALFCSVEEELARPRHLDWTLASAPELALAALREELLRLRAAVAGLAERALRPETGHAAVERAAESARTLAAVIADFVARVGAETMPADVAEGLARMLRVARYLDEVARLSPRLHGLALEAAGLPEAAGRAPAAALIEAARSCIALAGRAPDAAGTDADRVAASEGFEAVYHDHKRQALHAAVERRLGVEATDRLLDATSSLRRLVEQLVKADRLLRTPSRAAEIEAGPENGPRPPADGLAAATEADTAALTPKG